MTLLNPTVRAALDDRSIAILEAANLERDLERALIHRMAPLSSAEIKALFIGDTPLGSFSAKIKIARAFGLIGPKTTKEFDTIRQIRNVFAHAAYLVSFKDDEIKTACKKLQAIAAAERPDFSFYARSKSWPPPDPRDRYLHSINVWGAALAQTLYEGNDLSLSMRPEMSLPSLRD